MTNMMKLALVSFVLSQQLALGFRVHTLKEASDTNTTFDILLCDKMCMQCPSGKNILIQRQKSTLRGAFSIGAGLMTWGLGTPLINQLAGCNKIGFEFWQNRKALAKQPLQTDAWFGLLFPHSGLEKMQEEADKDLKSNEQDLEAIKHCSRLSDAYLWQAIRGAFTLKSGHSRQQDFARKCLAHSQLCGGEMDFDAEALDESAALNVARFNPFTHNDMCSTPKEGTPDDDSNLSEYEKLLRDAERIEEADIDELVIAKIHDNTPDVLEPELVIEDPVDKAEIIIEDDDAEIGTGGKTVDELAQAIADEEAKNKPKVNLDKKAIVTDATNSADAVEAAGVWMDKASDSGNADDLSAAQVAKVAASFCNSDEQKERCEIAFNVCKIRCCQDVCTFYTTDGSCIWECWG